MKEYTQGALEALAWTLRTTRSLKVVKKNPLDALEHQTATLIEEILESSSEDFRSRIKATA
jgi:hypothetical protein